jgi:chromatin segregation and condensation protein Rec8/ScpA/Scc1 (kleisin family)
MPKTQQVELEPERLSVAQRIAEVLERLAGGGEMRFEELFSGAREVGAVVVTFLAVLELVRLRLLRIWQTEAYGEIRVASAPAGTEGVGAPPAAAPGPGADEDGEPTEERGHTEERDGD